MAHVLGEWPELYGFKTIDLNFGPPGENKEEVDGLFGKMIQALVVWTGLGERMTGDPTDYFAYLPTRMPDLHIFYLPEDFRMDESFCEEADVEVAGNGCGAGDVGSPKFPYGIMAESSSIEGVSKCYQFLTVDGNGPDVADVETAEDSPALLASQVDMTSVSSVKVTLARLDEQNLADLLSLEASSGRGPKKDGRKGVRDVINARLKRLRGLREKKEQLAADTATGTNLYIGVRSIPSVGHVRVIQIKTSARRAHNKAAFYGFTTVQMDAVTDATQFTLDRRVAALPEVWLRQFPATDGYGCWGAMKRLCNEGAADSPFRFGKATGGREAEPCYDAVKDAFTTVVHGDAAFVSIGLAPATHKRRSPCTQARDTGCV
jgi:hypothetical protein